MIKVLVVEDSPSIRDFLVYVLSSDPQINVVEAVKNGKEAIEANKSKKPDIITMDIHMPEMDGFEATRKIMETQPVPIVIVSGSSAVGEVKMTFKAMEAGALAVIARPKGIGHTDHEANKKDLIQTVKLMSEVKVVRRWSSTKKEIPLSKPIAALEKSARSVKVVAIGASTGGPIALKTILSGLPRNFPVPILIVQHIAQGFLAGLANWLDQSTNLPVHIAVNGECPLPGHIYLAPEGFHMLMKNRNQISLSTDEPKEGLRPSVSYLFESVANVFEQNAVGILLTGMGDDGAYELKLMKNKGAITIAQDEASSVVHGMPGQAIKLSAATHVLSPEKIAAALSNLPRSK